MLTEQQCDIGFVESPTVPHGLHSLTVAPGIRLVLVVAASHPWARRRRPLTIAETRRHAPPWSCANPGLGTRTTLDLALADYERPAPLLELGSAAAIRTSVLDAVGPAVTSSLAVDEQLRSGELRAVDVDGLDLARVLRAVWRPPRQLDGPAAELIRIIRRS